MAAEATPESLRESRSLRALTKPEDGTDVFLLPNGVYGFTYSPAQREMPIYAGQPLHSFEVHRLADGSVHMVGYVTPETLSRIEAKAGTLEAVLYPSPFQSSTKLVSLDVAVMQPAKKAISREDGNPLKTLVYPE
jgi:hypothetical protein